jgi:hypothetical protein
VYTSRNTQTVTKLVGDKFRIDTRLTTETGMRAAQDLKRRPNKGQPNRLPSLASGMNSRILDGAESPVWFRNLGVSVQAVA